MINDKDNKMDEQAVSTLIGALLTKQADFPWKSIGGMLGGGAIGGIGTGLIANAAGAGRSHTNLYSRLGGAAGMLGGGMLGGYLEDEDDIDDEAEAIAMLEQYVAQNSDKDPGSAQWAQEMLNDHSNYKKVLGQET